MAQLAQDPDRCRAMFLEVSNDDETKTRTATYSRSQDADVTGEWRRSTQHAAISVVDGSL